MLFPKKYDWVWQSCCLVWPQVKSLANPFAYEEYRKDKIRQKIEESRTQRVQVKVRGSDRMFRLSTSSYSFTSFAKRNCSNHMQITSRWLCLAQYWKRILLSSFYTSPPLKHFVEVNLQTIPITKLSFASQIKLFELISCFLCVIKWTMCCDRDRSCPRWTRSWRSSWWRRVMTKRNWLWGKRRAR